MEPKYKLTVKFSTFILKKGFIIDNTASVVLNRKGAKWQVLSMMQS